MSEAEQNNRNVIRNSKRVTDFD